MHPEATTAPAGRTGLHGLAAAGIERGTASTAGLSVLRLNLLRAGYLLLVVGLGSQMAPHLIAEGPALEVMHGVVLSMLCALGLLSVLGLRYPLRMLPLLFFEMAWKLIWLIRIALPLWAAHRIDDAVASTLIAVLMVAVFPFLIPWSYVIRTYFSEPAEPWRSRTAAAPGQ